MSWPRLPLVPVPSITSVLTARIRSRPPSAAAASLIICCSGVACEQAVNAAAANNASHVVRFIFELLSRGLFRCPWCGLRPRRRRCHVLWPCMPWLVYAKFPAARQHHVCQQAPRLFRHRTARHVLIAHVRDERRDVIAHQIEFVDAIRIGG